MSTIRLKDYCDTTIIEDTDDINNIRRIANIGIEELCKREKASIIVYPDKVGRNYDGIEQSQIISMNESAGNAFIKSGDILGFIGVNGTYLSIGTRFTGDKDFTDDYLLHYMLGKVLKINIFNLPHPTGDDAVLDILAYIFPGLLSKALRQGILRRYTKYQRNDANVKGPIDISRHVRLNMPFNGKIAYTQRDYSLDNVSTQLIRHTIEYIQSTGAKDILSSSETVKADVAAIIAATPDYDRNRRNSIIAANKRRNPHPYYTSYEPLLKLCIDILEHRKIRYSEERKEIYGILFSGSWLWEEYLSEVVFKPLGFMHPDNRKKTHAIHIFNGKIDFYGDDEEVIEKNYAPRYPDYMYVSAKDHARSVMIADAKYRHYSYCGDRDNLHQLITYMYITQSQSGVLVYPIGVEEECEITEKLRNEWQYPKAINGYGGKYFRVGFQIPRGSVDFGTFSAKMREEESRILKAMTDMLTTK
ncbi:MAG: McrC family protein [Duncaniella sp.]|nr:McrC family protein [Duncaniella sp.]